MKIIRDNFDQLFIKDFIISFIIFFLCFPFVSSADVTSFSRTPSDALVTGVGDTASYSFDFAEDPGGAQTCGGTAINQIVIVRDVDTGLWKEIYNGPEDAFADHSTSTTLTMDSIHISDNTNAFWSPQSFYLDGSNDPSLFDPDNSNSWCDNSTFYGAFADTWEQALGSATTSSSTVVTAINYHDWLFISCVFLFFVSYMTWPKIFKGISVLSSNDN